jgi:putative ABC transport system substrate-binding protein
MKRMHTLLLIIALATLVGWWSFSTHTTEGSASAKHPKIAIIQMIEHPALDQTRKGILDGLNQKGIIIDTQQNSVYESAQGNPALATQIVQKYVGQNVSIIIALGTMPAQAAKKAIEGSLIPLVFASVSDPLSARLVDSLNAPGGMITGVSNYVPITQQFTFFKRIVPDLKRLGVVFNPGEANSVFLVEKMTEVAAAHNLTLMTAVATKTSDVIAATNSLLTKVDALFINNDSTALAAFDAIAKVAHQHSVPVFVSDIDCFDKGAVAVQGPDQYDLGLQTADMVERILKGEKPGSISVEGPRKVDEKINTTVAQSIGLIFHHSPTLSVPKS